MFNGIYAAQINRVSFSSSEKRVETTGTTLSHAILRGGALNEYERKKYSNHYYDNLMDTIDQYEKMA